MDPRKFAHQGVTLEGQIPAEGMPRLVQAVNTVNSPVDARLHFERDPSGHRILSGTVKVAVSATCQRCMEPKELQVESDIAVAVVRSDDEAKALPRSLEPWLVDSEDGEADVYAVVEDELLLDLPMVVYHDYQCIDQALYSAGEEAKSSPEQGERNPFKVLEQLKGGRKK
ncbi:YceD family protein [Gilvimarinus sp. F26214L]|uniref:YceD family protein n=1 Tax=Gilvimarinus sp. DZF01 TaxID=3461371 RepID=UPI004045D401